VITPGRVEKGAWSNVWYGERLARALLPSLPVRFYLGLLKISSQRTGNQLFFLCLFLSHQSRILKSLFHAIDPSKPNNNKLIQNKFWPWSSFALIVLRSAQINRRYKSEELLNLYSWSQKKCKRLRVQLARADLTAWIWSPVFNPEKTSPFPLPKNKQCTKRSYYFI